MSTPTEVAEFLTNRAMGKPQEDAGAPPKEVAETTAGDDEQAEQVEATEQNDDGAAEDTDSDDQTVSEGEETKPEESEEAEAQQDEGDDDPQYLDGDDDNLVVKYRVDGEEVEATLSELVAKASGNGAIEARLREATEARKEAITKRDQTLQEANQIREAAVKVLQTLDQQLHTPLVNAPNESLRQTNPALYLKQLEAYTQDQERIKESKSTLEKAFKDQGQAYQQLTEKQKKETAQIITDSIPAMANPDTRKAATADIQNSAQRYGYSQEEVASLQDPRIYLMAYDAEQYHKMVSGTGKVTTKDADDNAAKPAKPKKVLRAGRTKPRSAKARANDKIAEAKKAAAKTGKVDDVANFLVARATNR